MTITLGLWDQLVDCICRPPRDEYQRDSLIGGRNGLFKLGKTHAKRTDLNLTNKHGLRLECSHFVPQPTADNPGPWPCVVYCHCNSGSRKDAEEAVYLLLPLGISVFCMDFAGSGLSEGQWVTLGAYEADDLEVVIQHLRQQSSVSMIGLWGRSMGAVTCLLYSRRDPSVAGMVLDSPFSKLTDLMMELVSEQKLRIPKAFMKMAVGAMRRSVKKRAKFDINDVAPLEVVGESFIPALFGHADGDTFIKIRHSQNLFEAYAGDKNFIRFHGDHNTRRPESFYTSVYIFFHNTLKASLALGGAVMSQDELCQQACQNLTLHGQQTSHQHRDLAVPWSTPEEGLLGSLAPPRSLSDANSSESSADMSDPFQQQLFAQLMRLSPDVNGSSGEQMDNINMSEEEQLARAIQLSMMEAGDANGASPAEASSSPRGPAGPTASSSPPCTFSASPSRLRPTPTRPPPSGAVMLVDDEEAMIQEAIRLSLQEFNTSHVSSSPPQPAAAPQCQQPGTPSKHLPSTPPNTSPQAPVTQPEVSLLGDVVQPPQHSIEASLKAEMELEALQNSMASVMSTANPKSDATPE